MIAQLRSELLKQRTTRTTVLLAAWMLGLILVIVLMHVLALKTPQLSKAANQPMVYGWGTSIGALFSALLGAIGLTGELRSGLIRPTLVLNPKRAAVFAATLAASMLTGVMVGLLAEGLVAGIASTGLAIRGIHITLSAGDFAEMMAGGGAAAALWAAIGTGVGAIVRNQPGAVVGLCVWVLLLETVLIGDVPSAAKYTPGAAAGALAGLIQNAPADTLLAPGLGALLLAGYALAAGGAGALAIARRDIE